MSSKSCPFCERVRAADLLAANDLAVAFYDAYPISPGHALIAPRRHVMDYFSLSEDEQVAMWQLVPEVRGAISATHEPDGFNVGVNAGESAGQTVAHAHLHVIPRYRGDVEDPRGGIRWILPDKARYWDG